MDFDQNVYELRSQLNSHQAINRSFLLIDGALWKACYDTLLQDVLIRGKELNFVDLGCVLSNRLAKARPVEYGQLAESSICSFIPSVSAEEICNEFGMHPPLKNLETEYASQYFRVRFAAIYWGAVRDVAVVSKSDCVSYFSLPSSIVELLSTVDSSSVMDFCHGNPNLQNFRLKCPVQDCLAILDIAADPNMSEEEKSLRLTMARLRKANHCETFKKNMEALCR